MPVGRPWRLIVSQVSPVPKQLPPAVAYLCPFPRTQDGTLLPLPSHAKDGSSETLEMGCPENAMLAFPAALILLELLSTVSLS